MEIKLYFFKNLSPFWGDKKCLSKIISFLGDNNCLQEIVFFLWRQKNVSFIGDKKGGNLKAKGAHTQKTKFMQMRQNTGCSRE